MPMYAFASATTCGSRARATYGPDASTRPGMSRSRNSLVWRSSLSSSRRSETSRKVRMAWPFCDRRGPADTDNVRGRPSLVCTRRSAESTRPPPASSRQRRVASIALSFATNSGRGNPRASSPWRPRIEQPAGLTVRTRPCSSSTAMPSLMWLKKSSYRRNCDSSPRSSAARISVRRSGGRSVAP